MIRNSVPRVAAINDLSGFGRASLTVAIPILSAMEVQACPIPTAVLSTHTTGFVDYAFYDMTDFMSECVKHWTNLGLKFDAVYSGFLGSSKQMDIVGNFIESLSSCDPLVVIDPVMGDDGERYGPITPDMVDKMREFIRFADLITPNTTEAAFLLNEKYDDSIDEDIVLKWLKRLSDMGPRIVVVTGVPTKSRRKVLNQNPEDAKGKKYSEFADRTSVLAYDREAERIWKVSCDYIPAHYPGTGDAFTSVLVGSLLKGDSLPLALDRAVSFTTLAIRASFGHKAPAREGVMLERVLDSLRGPVVMSSYELVK